MDDISLISEESTVCTARAVTQGSHTHGRAARLQTILHHPRASSPHAPQTSLPATAWCTSEVTLHPRTRTARQIIMNPRLGQSPSSCAEARGIDMTSRAGSAISSHLFPTRLVMPSSQSIVVMIGSVSIMRLQVTLTRALMHSVIHTAFPCDCISSWKWIEMEMDPI